MSTLGLSPAEFANPETRIPARVAGEWLALVTSRPETASLGLRAGQLLQPGDFAQIERATESCATLREANGCFARYAKLLNESIEIELEETPKHGILRYASAYSASWPIAADDFFVASLVSFARRQTGRLDIPAEIHFMHPEPAYVAEYRRFFRAPIIFRAPYNAIAIPHESINAPMRWANPASREAFELHARDLMTRLEVTNSFAAKVRELVLARISRESVEMGAAARKLGLSVATLRRRLLAEQANYSEIVDDVRKEMAMRHLRDQRRKSVTEVASLLGFSDAASFHRAFKRWTGQTLTSFRAEAAHDAGSRS